MYLILSRVFNKNFHRSIHIYSALIKKQFVAIPINVVVGFTVLLTFKRYTESSPEAISSTSHALTLFTGVP